MSVDSARVEDPLPYGVGMPSTSIMEGCYDFAPYSCSGITFKALPIFKKTLE